jgi:phosphatidylserine/phosphatidylglycerophosphate/cardiolipin synthase-like enzyme
VRIVYSFMSAPIYSLLTWGTGPRMVARRVLFPGPAGIVASKYSHMKMFAASGNIAGDRSNWVVWTGSNNWSDRGLRSDEVTLRIRSRAVYDAYVRHWKYIRHRRSSALWATYEEPVGGGRAP